MKKLIVMILCGAMIFSLAACGVKNNAASEKSDADNEDNDVVQIPNPWVDCSSLEEAADNAGFTLTIPETIKGYWVSSFRNMGKEMIDVDYEAEDDSGNSIGIRKGIGTDDISGDYSEYSESNQVTVGNYDVAMKGNNGSVSLSTWVFNGFSYVLYTPEMSVEAVTDIIQSIQ